MTYAELKRGLGGLASIGSTAPFIGLFGTVWGIMSAFEGIGRTGSTNLGVVSRPIADATALKPGSLLSYEQTRDMHPLPQAVASIDGLQGLKFVKGKDKVFLVRPSSGIVVDEITM